MKISEAKKVLRDEGLLWASTRPVWFSELNIGSTNRMKAQLIALCNASDIPLYPVVCTGRVMQSIATRDAKMLPVSHIQITETGITVTNYRPWELDYEPQHVSDSGEPVTWTAKPREVQDPTHVLEFSYD